MFDMNAESYIGLAGKAFITGISVAALYGGVSVFACRSEISQLKAIIRH